jgi:hypothetical protein
MDDDTWERKKRESVTETRLKRLKRLKKKRSREAGSKNGKTATELEDADTDD